MNYTINSLAEIWSNVLLRIENEIQDNNIYATFFANTKVHNIDGDTLIISVPGKYVCEVLNSKYLNSINEKINAVTESNFRCQIVEESKLKNSESNTNLTSEATFKSSFFNTNLNPQYTFDNFVVGPSNRECHSASLAASLDPGNFFNPLFIHGKSGLGKTHLLNAIGNYIKVKNPRNIRVLFISANDFVDSFVRSAKFQDNGIEAFKDEFRHIDVLLIDDIQFLANKDKSSELFFHLFNHLINNRKQIVLTNDRPPHELKGLEERLVSRFASGLSVGIDSPEFETALSILYKRLEQQGISKNSIDEEVLHYIAQSFSSDVRQLEGALNRILFYSITFNSPNKKIDMQMALSAFKNSGVNQKEELTVDKIKRNVASYYNISVEALSSKIRTSYITTARHIAMYLCRSMLNIPLIEIGRNFSNRDHSTVISSCNKVDKLLKNDETYRKAIEEIKKSLKI